jgi:hypothetical protein
MERSFRTDEKEFYQVQTMPADRDGSQAALLAWNRVNEQVRFIKPLVIKPPNSFTTTG